MEEQITELFNAYPTLGTILAVVVAAHALALVVVNLTPTPKDDKIVSRVYKVVEWLAGIVSSKSKD